MCRQTLLQSVCTETTNALYKCSILGKGLSIQGFAYPWASRNQSPADTKGGPRVCPHIPSAHMHMLTPVRTYLDMRTRAPHAHRHPRLADGQREPLLGCLCSRRRAALPPGTRQQAQLVSLLFIFFGFFVVPPGPQTFFPSKDSHSCCWALGWADRVQTQRPAPICLLACTASSGPQVPPPPTWT